MKSHLFACLTLALTWVSVYAADELWQGVGEITLTLPSGASKASSGHFVRVTFLKDGTAVKRDFSANAVFNGSVAKGVFESLAKAVVEEDAFGKPPERPIGNKVKEAVVVLNEKKTKFRMPPAQKAPAMDRLEAAIDKVTWKKM